MKVKLKEIKYAFILGLGVMIGSCAVREVLPYNPKKEARQKKVTAGQKLLGSLDSIKSSYDAVSYRIIVDFEHQTQHIHGKVGIAFKALSQIDNFHFDLAETMNIDNVTFRGNTLQPTKRVFRSVYLRLPSRLEKNDTGIVWVEYSGKINKALLPPWKGGLVWRTQDTKPWVGIACESEGASTWFPCKDHSSDEPDSVRMTFGIDRNDVRIVSNGKLISETFSNKGYQSEWKISYPINLYNISFYIGDYVAIEDTLWGIKNQIIPIQHYVLAKNKDRAEVHFRQFKVMVRTFENLIGEYPWYQDGARLVESSFKGMEHQTAIAYGNGYKNDLRGKYDYLMLHELGHEWFGNAITAADFRDMWLQEGITTYCEALFLEKQLGENAMNAHLGFYRLLIQNRRPVLGVPGVRHFDYKDTDVYFKGAWFMHTLRNWINNDSLFLACLQNFYHQYRYKTCTTEDFLKSCEQTSGLDVKWLANQYLYKRKIPVLSYKLSADGGLVYRWKETSEEFDKITLKILIKYPNSGEWETKYLKPTSLNQKISVRKNGQIPESIQFDYSKYLYISRLQP